MEKSDVSCLKNPAEQTEKACSGAYAVFVPQKTKIGSVYIGSFQILKYSTESFWYSKNRIFRKNPVFLKTLHRKIYTDLFILDYS